MKILRVILFSLIVIAVLLAVAIVVVKYVRQPKVETPITNTNTNNQNATTNQNLNSNQSPVNENESVEPIVNLPTNSSPSTVEASLGSIARSFAERFGTYSNHSNYENVSHLMPYMSQKMKNWATDFLEDKTANPDYSGIYHGLTTKALSAQTASFDASAGQAEIIVKTQRKESTGTTANSTITYQDIAVSFVKEQGVWKVDDAVWR